APLVYMGPHVSPYVSIRPLRTPAEPRARARVRDRIPRMPAPPPPSAAGRGLTLTQQIVLGLIVGIIAGALVSRSHPEWARYFNPFSQLFLRLIKMIIAPLIFGTLVA